MNRAELITRMGELIMEQNGGEKVPRKDIDLFINAFTSSIHESLENGEAVKIVGHGVYEVRKRKGKKAVNPKSLEPVIVSEKQVPVFRPGKPLKERINDLKPLK